jgi:hypothetical protein
MDRQTYMSKLAHVLSQSFIMNAPKRTNMQNALTLSSLVLHSNMYLEVGVKDYILKLSSDIMNSHYNKQFYESCKCLLY